MGRKMVILLFLLLFIISSCIGVYIAVNSNKNIDKEDTIVESQEVSMLSEDEQAYKEGTEAIDRQDYVSSTAKLKRFEKMDVLSDSLKDAKNVYFYSQAQMYYKDGNKMAALNSIQKIPLDYIGKYSAEIGVLRDLLSVKKDEKKVENTANTTSAITASQNLKEPVLTRNEIIIWQIIERERNNLVDPDALKLMRAHVKDTARGYATCIVSSKNRGGGRSLLWIVNDEDGFFVFDHDITLDDVPINDSDININKLNEKYKKDHNI